LTLTGSICRPQIRLRLASERVTGVNPSVDPARRKAGHRRPRAHAKITIDRRGAAVRHRLARQDPEAVGPCPGQPTAAPPTRHSRATPAPPGKQRRACQRGPQTCRLPTEAHVGAAPRRSHRWAWWTLVPGILRRVPSDQGSQSDGTRTVAPRPHAVYTGHTCTTGHPQTRASRQIAPSPHST